MTAAYVAAGVRSASASTITLTPALPSITGRNLGILVAIATHKSNDALTTATVGWTALTQDNSGAAFTARAFIAPPGSSAPLITAVGAAAMSAQIFYIEDPDNPMDATAIGNTSVGTNTVNPHTSASINTTRYGSLIFGYDVASANTPLAAPTGFTLNNDEGSATDAGRTSVFTRWLGNSGSASSAVSVTGAVAAWVQRQVELRIVAPAAGMQVTQSETATALNSSIGVAASAVNITATLNSGFGIGVTDMEIVGVLVPGVAKKRRSYAQVFQ